MRTSTRALTQSLHNRFQRTVDERGQIVTNRRRGRGTGKRRHHFNVATAMRDRERLII
jgi:hypothetical protein